MLDRYIGKWMVLKNLHVGFKNCNTNQIFIFGGYVKVEESWILKLLLGSKLAYIMSIEIWL